MKYQIPLEPCLFCDSPSRWIRHLLGGAYREYAICFDCGRAGNDRDIPALRAKLREPTSGVGSRRYPQRGVSAWRA